MKKLTRLLSGLLFPAGIFITVNEYLRGRSLIAPALLTGLILLIFLSTGDADAYRYYPLWKKVLRLLLFDGFIYLVLMAALRFYEKDLETAPAYALFAFILGLLYLLLTRRSLYYEYRRIEKMNGHEFEYFCAEVLRRNHFHDVRVTKGSHDYGADILAMDADDCLWAVQCKRYDGTLGNTPVQEVVAAMQYYEAENAAVMTNSAFTANAEKLAAANGVWLIDGNELGQLARV